MKYKILFSVIVTLHVAASYSQVYYTNPVLIGNGHLKDPCVWKTEKKDYLLFTTHTIGKGCFYKSNDLVNWEKLNNIPYDSVTQRQLGELFSKSGQITNCNIWAPQVIRIGEKWNMYFSLSNKGGIVVLQSNNPKGPYCFMDNPYVLIHPSDLNWEYDAIDPFVVKENGKCYIFFGSAFGIYRAMLTDDGTHIKKDNKFVHVAGPISPRNEVGGAVHGGMEGVALYKHKGWWYLFCSKRTDYSIYVGRAKNLTDNFVDKEGRLLTDGYGTRIVYPTDEFLWPGHNSEIIKDKIGKTYMYYFTKINKEKDKSQNLTQIVMSEILWDNEGWPYIKNHKTEKEKNIRPRL